jgi:hypothetical protein
MIQKLVLAVVVAIAVGLVCMLLGAVIGSLNVPIAETIGHFLTAWGWVIGVLAGLWYFFAGVTFSGFGPRS